MSIEHVIVVAILPVVCLFIAFGAMSVKGKCELKIWKNKNGGGIHFTKEE